MRMYAFDTNGTTIRDFREPVYRALFEHAPTLLDAEGRPLYSPEQIPHFQELYRVNPTNPELIRQTNAGKIEVVRRGLVKVEFFPDVRPTFAQLQSRGNSVCIFSKGDLDFVQLVYELGGFADLVPPGAITSSGDFKTRDKNNPECYRELDARMNDKNEDLAAYTSDDPAEVNAFLEAFPDRWGFWINRGQGGEENLTERAIRLASLEDILTYD